MSTPFEITVPTVDAVLAQTSIGGEFHRWAVEGGSIILTNFELRAALEAAYDASNPEWRQLVEIEDQGDDDYDDDYDDDGGRGVYIV